jgi:hypothetical protein
MVPASTINFLSNEDTQELAPGFFMGRGISRICLTQIQTGVKSIKIILMIYGKAPKIIK